MYVTKACLECKQNLPLEVTAGPTLGLIPGIHLQRHCQSASTATQSRKGRVGAGGGVLAGYRKGRERETDEREEGRKKKEGTDVKSAEYKGEECLSEVGPSGEQRSSVYRLTVVWIFV